MTHYDVLVAAKGEVETALSALASFSGVTVTVAVQKKVYFDKDRSTLPFVIVSGEDGDRAKSLAFGKKALLSFPVNVTFLQAGRATLTDPAAMRRQEDAREAIRTALSRRTLGDLGFAGVSYDAGPSYDAGDLARHYDLSKQRFVYRKSGDRSS